MWAYMPSVSNVRLQGVSGEDMMLQVDDQTVHMGRAS